MPIIIEEENNTGRNAVIISAFLMLLVAAGFLIWQVSREKQIPTPSAPANVVQINKEIFDDSRLDQLELFPEIPPATVETARKNPFVESIEQPSTGSVAEDVNASTELAPSEE